MTLVPFNRHEIDSIEDKRPKNEDVTNMLIEFITSDHDCVEVLEYRYQDAFTCRASLHSTIRKLGLLSVTVRMRGRRVFLIKEQ